MSVSQAELWSSKAENLARLEGRLQQARVLPQVCFSPEQWRQDPDSVLGPLTSWLNQAVIVRSSALTEDSASESLAGHFLSVLGVRDQAGLVTAIEQVISGFDGESGHQVFVQPQLENISLSGVAFSRDPNTGSPYLVINYDDVSGSSDSVTSGRSNQLRTLYHFRGAHPFKLPEPCGRVLELIVELESVYGPGALDIEFAFSANVLYLLQVRPLKVPACPDALEQTLQHNLQAIERRLSELNCSHPDLHGERTVFGVMPDWNPAEIIGVRPGVLARSLYQELVTDAIWAYQRHNYGYRNLRSFPLLQSFGGCPYIDVRLSFNSFLPADLPPELAERLTNYYLERLLAVPSHHDKVEFEILFSCYTLDLPDRLKVLHPYGFSAEDCAALGESLRGLTNRIIHNHSGLWKQDIAKIQQLEQRQSTLAGAGLEPVPHIYWLLEDCKRYGTLPFAGLARAGFIAVQMLRSLVSSGILSPAEYERFMASLDTVSSRIGRDFHALSQSAFLNTYGHLRPGTYDLLSPRYDEAPERYFDWSRPAAKLPDPEPFVLSLSQLKAIETQLRRHDLVHDVIGLFDFIKEAIEGREYAKFVFTRNLSEALSRMAALAEACGLSREAAAQLDIRVIYSLYTSSLDPAELLRQSAAAGAAQHQLTRQLVLPPLITRPQDIWSFELAQGEPNYITLRQASGPVATADLPHPQLAGAILLIESADPGFDWVFAHGIGGLITMYGGANSHMAIRAGELGIPAVIGAGEVLYGHWRRARQLELDCANHQVRVLQ